MTAKEILFAAASLASFASYGLHAFAGGALMARPFYRRAAMYGVNTHAFRYCWHFVSATLIATGAGFAFLATEPQYWPLGVFLTLSSLGCSVLSVAVAGIEKSAAIKSPPTILCVIIAAFGGAALFN